MTSGETNVQVIVRVRYIPQIIEIDLEMQRKLRKIPQILSIPVQKSLPLKLSMIPQRRTPLIKLLAPMQLRNKSMIK